MLTETLCMSHLADPRLMKYFSAKMKCLVDEIPLFCPLLSTPGPHPGAYGGLVAS